VHPQKPVDITADTFQKEVLAHSGVVLVDFWSPYCSHCQSLNLVLDQLAQDKGGTLKIAKVNALTEKDLASQFKIFGVPRLFLYQNGSKISEITGALQKQELETWIHSSVST
jgi:thioredoxin